MGPYDYALLAQEAYSVAPDIGKVDGASRAIVRQTAAGLVVAFRGSDDEDSWLTDFDAVPMNVPGVGEVHRGFWQAWKVIAVDVLAAIDGKPVTIVGHSLGGALALMAAIEMVISGNPPSAVYGFEAPCVSPGSNVAQLLASVPVSIYRNGLDIVPIVPPDWPPAAPLIRIGTPELPFPNTLDHQLEKVIAALAAAQPAAA
jgi:predicted lipase